MIDFSDVLRLLHDTPDPLSPPDARWAWVTLALSAAVIAGYATTAVQWYCQSSLARRAESRAAAARLRNVVLCCAACGFAFHQGEFGWLAWRAYDVVLLMLACHVWSFAARGRGVGLVHERLAEVAELERSSAKYREIAELLPHAVWTAGSDGAVDFSNRQWVAYAGEGRTWLDAVHPADRAEVGEWWRAAVAARVTVSREVRLGDATTAEGPAGTQPAGQPGATAYRTFVVRATPVAQGDGVRWLGACSDVEDQKRVAAEKEHQARQRAFLFNALSHDLRAPLHNVVLNAHLLKMTAREPADAESVDMILENAAAAGDLVTGLLDFARAGEDRAMPERVDVPALLQQVARRFSPVAERKGLYVSVADETPADGAATEAWADRQKLERVVANLVDNAIKFTAHGGVTLTLLPGDADGGGDESGVGECDGGAGLVAVAGSGVLRLRVADTGIGVAAENVPFLFDEFYQVSNHERDRNKGFGIGLAICRALARQLGGDVRLAHTGPGGSCFEVRVPAAAAGPTADASDVAADVAGSGREHDAEPRVGAGRGGRPDGAPRDRQHPQAAGFCRV